MQNLFEEGEEKMKSMFAIEEALGSWLLRDYRRRTFRQAKTRAYAAFIQKYPRWEEHLFDEHFLTHRAAIILETYLQGHTPDAGALAQAWADQWGWKPEARATHIAELTPVLADFLYLLETELRGVRFANRPDTSSVATGLTSA